VSALLNELESKEKVNVENETEAIRNCAGLTYAGAYLMKSSNVFDINFSFSLASAESVCQNQYFEHRFSSESTTIDRINSGIVYSRHCHSPGSSSQGSGRT
jgi:hypothetical protein